MEVKVTYNPTRSLSGVITTGRIDSQQLSYLAIDTELRLYVIGGIQWVRDPDPLLHAVINRP